MEESKICNGRKGDDFVIVSHVKVHANETHIALGLATWKEAEANKPPSSKFRKVVLISLFGLLALLAGAYFLIYHVVTTNTHKLNLGVSVDIPEGIQCGHWDESSARVLSHAAFQPFDWPAMTESSPPYVDIKVKVGGMLLLRVILKSSRSRTDDNPEALDW